MPGQQAVLTMVYLPWGGVQVTGVRLPNSTLVLGREHY
jgi:hypothetical protein